MRAECHGGDRRAADDFVYKDIIHKRKTAAPDFLRVAKCPQAEFLGLVHQRPHSFAAFLRSVRQQLFFLWIYTLLDEIEHVRSQGHDMFRN